MRSWMTSCMIALGVPLSACSNGGGSSASFQISAPRPVGVQLASDQTLEAEVIAEPGGGASHRSASFPLGGRNSVIKTQLVGLRSGTQSVRVEYSVDDPRFGKVLIASIEHSIALTRGFHALDFTADEPAYAHDADGVTNLQKLYIGVDPGRDLAHFAQVSAGLSHTCAIRDDGALWCWGSNHQGQLGSNANIGGDDANPTPVAIDGSWTRVSAGDYHTCAIREDGTLWCWGDNGHGQLGRTDGLGDVSADVRQVGSDSDWVRISAGTDHTCGVRGDGTLWCWGAGMAGQLGVASNGDVAEPVEVAVEDAAWADVSAGTLHTCGLSSGNEMWCWGSNLYGQLGVMTNAGAGDPNPGPANVGGEWTAPSARGFQTCAVRMDGTLWCWGSNQSGQLGRTEDLGSDAAHAVPLEAGGPLTGWQMVSEGQLQGCSLDEDGALWCWGNGSGEVDRTVDADDRSFVPPASDSTWQSVSVGGTHACAIRSSGTLWCWGTNAAGQLGNTLDFSVLPVPVAMSSP